MNGMSKLYAHISDSISRSDNVSFRVIPRELILNSKPQATRLYIAISELHRSPKKDEFFTIKSEDIKKITGLLSPNQTRARLELETLGLIEFKGVEGGRIAYRVSVPKDDYIKIESKLIFGVDVDYVRKLQALLISDNDGGILPLSKCKQYFGRRVYGKIKDMREKFSSDESLYDSLHRLTKEEIDKAKEGTDEYRDLLDFMENLYGSKFSSSVNKKYAQDILLKTANIEDVKLVVAYLYEEWKDSEKMTIHLNPKVVLNPFKFYERLEKARNTNKGKDLLIELKEGSEITIEKAQGLLDDKIYKVTIITSSEGVDSKLSTRKLGKVLKRLTKEQGALENKIEKYIFNNQ